MHPTAGPPNAAGSGGSSPGRSRRGGRWLAIVSALALAVSALGMAYGPQASAAETADSPALTPPMGWNSWNTYYCNINEAKIRAAVDAMVSSGMKDAGYEYVVVDDCWQAPQRDANGALQADPTRFPSGMKALGDYIHDRGLKFGIYQAPREKTCAQYFGSTAGATGARGHEVQDAETFAAWGVDFLKYDWCSNEGTLEEQIEAFTLMRDALRATGRPIVYSINPNSIRPNRGAEYYFGDIADMWRTTEDITAKWSSGCTGDCFMGVTEILDVQAGLTDWNGPGHWNDPDMLEVGKGTGLNATENRAHFGMWALMASPLIAGNDITTMSADVRSILSNRDIIAVNQDPNGVQASRIRDDGDVEIWRKPLSDGSVAVGLLNRGGSTQVVSTSAAEIGLAPAAGYALKELFTGGLSNSSGAISASVPRHGLALFRVTPGAVASTTFALRSTSADRCLDVLGGVLGDGPRAVLADCDSASLTQGFAAKDGQLIVGGKCLDVDRNLTANGTAVLFWECNGQTNQKWTIGEDGTVRSQSAGRCLDVDRGGTAAGTALLIWDCNGQTNQKWSRTTLADAEMPSVTASSTTRCVAGKVQVIATTTNASAGIADVELSGDYGDRALTVPSGKSVSVAFASRQSAVPAGSIEIDAVVAGVSQTLRADYAAKSCA
ncbi:MAG TPA: ricin-type beta-trefoil lectin domain protein [Arachnia sp.]|nr:ricin-type beta-trefoil lectin domain protein [Arachnia sp.]HMT85959.1 ricin-type beta-trefoil lectin domain protein [Arachnia sp.]